MQLVRLSVQAHATGLVEIQVTNDSEETVPK